MELREYWDLLRRRWWLPAGLTLLALVAATGFGLMGATAYKTELRLAISTLPSIDRAQSLYYDPVYYANLSSEYLTDDLSEIIRSTAFAADVAQEMGYKDVNLALISDVTRTRKTHRLIDVTITTSTAAEGRAIGEAMARILNDRQRVGSYLRQMDAYQGEVAIVNQPVTKRGNSVGGLIAEIGIRTLVGLMLGIALALLVEYLDQTVRSRKEAQQVLGLPILGEIPRASRGALA